MPAGWVIVAAGNPPEYNKSVRDFDIVTLDRVRRMDIEPDLPVWKDYARAAHIHSAILSYLELHPQNFYQINADVDGTQFVTARGWEDLSNLLDTYEQLGLQADEDLIKEYIQHPKIAEDFSAIWTFTISTAMTTRGGDPGRAGKARRVRTSAAGSL